MKKNGVTAKKAIVAMCMAAMLSLAVGCGGNATSSATAPDSSQSASSESVESSSSASGGGSGASDESSDSGSSSSASSSAASSSSSASIVDGYDSLFPEAGSDDLKKAFTFKLDGKEMTFDFPMSDLLNAGWSTEVPTAEGVSGAYLMAPEDGNVSGNTVGTFTLFKDESRFDVLVANFSEDPMAWADGMCAGIVVYDAKTVNKGSGFSVGVSSEATGFDQLDFETLDGIKVGMTAEEVLDTYGKPSNSISKSITSIDEITELDYKAKLVTSGVAVARVGSTYSGAEATIKMALKDGVVTKIEFWYPFGLK